jgi:hypothetical protein
MLLQSSTRNKHTCFSTLRSSSCSFSFLAISNWSVCCGLLVLCPDILNPLTLLNPNSVPRSHQKRYRLRDSAIHFCVYLNAATKTSMAITSSSSLIPFLCAQYKPLLCIRIGLLSSPDPQKRVALLCTCRKMQRSSFKKKEKTSLHHKP